MSNSNHNTPVDSDKVRQQIEARKLQNELDAGSSDRLQRMTSTAGKVTAALNSETDVLNSAVELKHAVMKRSGEFEGAGAVVQFKWPVCCV
ncbi:hypothetical protein BN2475_140052 [Paraburkholderia ribeironis]|uniref:Uncharacterized protein n=1 Tax=Paraburkholderia ribeironis TaxID=1247936 RepID=A0A1N7RTZ7_9BURK|nr:hypothetical protein [Paraburkholderia ribeironis]SIT38182.1 hypothetical protein BN2475_140052 [Paraburkholderia ribeironis]